MKDFGGFGNNSQVDFEVVGGTLYFSTNYQLWKTDGTMPGTTQVVAGGGYDPQELTAAGASLFYVAANEAGEVSNLWKSDGTEAGTAPITDFANGEDPLQVAIGLFDVVNVGGVVYFFSYDSDDHLKLWRTNGASTGTSLVKDLGQIYSGIVPTHATAFGGALYFSIYGDDSYGRLWKSDGSAGGTAPLVPDLTSYAPIPPLVFNGSIYFAANDDFGDKLYKSDGTSGGTVLVKHLSSYAAVYLTLTSAGGALYFGGSDGVHNEELWKSDGTAPGTALLKDINLRPGGSVPFAFENDGGVLLFRAQVAGARKLFRSDGTTAGTASLTDQLPHAGHLQFTENVAVVGNMIYYGAVTPDGAAELWKSGLDGAGAVCIKSVFPAGADGFVNLVTDVGGALYFVAITETTRSLWKSDGTEAGTMMLKSFDGAGFSFLFNLTNVAGRLFFTYDDAFTGTELWTSDGTETGTVMLKVISTNPGNAFIDAFKSVGSRLYFTATDGNVPSLWTSDGTLAGTVKIKDLPNYSNWTSFFSDAELNGYLYFPVQASAMEIQLWRTAGSATTTFLVKTITKQYDSDSIEHVTAADGRVYFLIKGALWTSDGTEAGTAPVPAPASGPLQGVRNLAAVGNSLYFLAYSAADGGVQIWTTDGTPAAPTRVTNFTGGGFPFPGNLLGVGSQLFFAADDGVHGHELWALNTAPSAEGDFDADGDADGRDFLSWQRSFGASVGPPGNGADGDGNGQVDAVDLAVWSGEFGAPALAAAAVSPADLSLTMPRAADAVFSANDFLRVFTPADADDHGILRKYRPRPRR